MTRALTLARDGAAERRKDMAAAALGVAPGLIVLLIAFAMALGTGGCAGVTQRWTYLDPAASAARNMYEDCVAEIGEKECVHLRDRTM